MEVDSSFLVWQLGGWEAVHQDGEEEEERVWVGKGMSSLLGQVEFEVPEGNGGGDTH